MFRRVTIERFRRFEHFELAKLGRVNLLVGPNNCGKTSLLEALSILAAQPDPRALYDALMRRGERLLVQEGQENRQSGADVCRLFHGFALVPGCTFSISGDGEIDKRVLATIEEPAAPPQISLFDRDRALEGGFRLVLRWNGVEGNGVALPLTELGGLIAELVRSQTIRSPEMQPSTPAPGPVRFVESSSLLVADVVRLFDDVALTAEEEIVLESLRIIEPSIERIASVTADRRAYPVRGRGGIVVRCTGIESRIPIGSMGDGIWRMLGLVLSLVRAANGVLLIDEIDTGLHYSVMADMWRLVCETARRLNVQVFATTHSSDCCSSLAAIADTAGGEAPGVTIQRIEPGNHRSVAFTDQEIVVAAERGIEVR